MQIRFRFVWNKASHPSRYAHKIVGLALVSEEESTAGHFKTIWLDLRLLLKLTAVSAVVLWFAAAAGLFFWLQKNTFNRVGYLDLACPWRWSRISDLRGQGYIAAGIDSMRLRKVDEGIFEIRTGLARHPDAAVARLAVAKYYAQHGYYAGVRAIMLPQIEWGAPHEFLRLLLESAAQNDDHRTMLTVCDGALARSGLTAAERGWLLERKASGLLELERFPAALAALDAAGQGRSLEWRRLHVLTLCGNGRATEALAEIGAWPAGVPPELRLQMLASTYRRAGRVEEMAATYHEMQRRHPTEPQPWLEAVAAFVRAGRPDDARKELVEYLRRFDADPAGIANASRMCAQVGVADLVALCADRAKEMGRPFGAMLADLVVARLSEGNVAAAEQAFQRLIDEDRRSREHVAKSPAGFQPRSALAASRSAQLRPALRDWLRSLLDAAALPPEDSAAVHCGVLITGNYFLQFYELSASVLAKVGHWPAVAAVTQAGLVRYRDTTRLTRWSESAAEKIAAMPPPPVAVVRPVAPKPPAAVAVALTPTRASAPAAPAVPPAPTGPDYKTMDYAVFLARVDAAMQRRDWAEALSVIHDGRRANAAWLSQAEADLFWREVRCGLELGDRPSVSLWLSQRLRVHPAEAARVLSLAHEWQGRGDAAMTRWIAQILEAAAPQFRPGRAFLTELNASEAPAKSH